MSTEDVEIGSITGTYFLDANGNMRVSVDRPDFDVIPPLVQLGIVELIRENVLHGEEPAE